MVAEDELLELIAANPQDPTPRAVYLDWLGDHGDPRARPKARAKGPLPELPGVARGIAGRPSWLGALAPYASARNCRFVDGVLETLALNDRRPQAQAHAEPGAPLADPRLATVRELCVRRIGAGPALFSSGAMKSLARVSGGFGALAALGPSRARAQAGRLERVRVVVDPGFSANEAARGKLPAAQELLLAFDPDDEDSPLQASLTPELARVAWLVARQLGSAARYEAFGLEVPDATFEGIAAWLGQAAEEEQALFVVQGASKVWLDPAAGLLRISPMAAGKVFEKRLVLLAMLLRALPEVPLSRVELDGPGGVEAQRLARRVVGPELRRRGDVRALTLGATAVLP